MPAGVRRQAQQAALHHTDPSSEPEDGDISAAAMEDQMDDVDVGGEEEGEDGYDEDEDDQLDEPSDPEPPPPGPPPLPAHLKDISGLASWTVSTAKPGCSVPQLRAPSTSLFWQSDGPQPHHLNIHFFKMVEIAGVRVYLDFDMDESYTPTKIAFLAGTGYNDLQEWCVMQFENPKGWLDVDFSGVAVGPDGDGDGDGAEEDGDADGPALGADDVRRKWPVLRAMLVQVQIRENHQNGKDTHLRGLQIFARDRGGAAARPEAAKPRRDSSAVKTGRTGGTGRRAGTWLPDPTWDHVPTLR